MEERCGRVVAARTSAVQCGAEQQQQMCAREWRATRQSEQMPDRTLNSETAQQTLGEPPVRTCTERLSLRDNSTQ